MSDCPGLGLLQNWKNKRGYSVSLSIMGGIEGPLEIPRASQTELRKALNCYPIIPRDPSISECPGPGIVYRTRALRKLVFHFLSHWMGYDRGDSFPFDFKPNGISFGSKSKGKPSPRSYAIQFERKWKTSFLSVESESVTLLRNGAPCYSGLPLNPSISLWCEVRGVLWGPQFGPHMMPQDTIFFYIFFSFVLCPCFWGLYPKTLRYHSYVMLEGFYGALNSPSIWWREKPFYF